MCAGLDCLRWSDSLQCNSLCCFSVTQSVQFGRAVCVRMCRAPDEAAVKKKMQHSSTKDFFRSMLEGIAVEIHATDKGDLGEAALRERVAQTVAKK